MLSILSGQPVNAQKLSWPEITRENKPWTRWWWPGSIVDTADLKTAMEKYSKAGLGGLELTVIYGVKGYEDRSVRYLSAKWMEMFTYTLKEAQKLDLGIDLANASGWPFGGPWVEPDDACKNINYKTWSLSEGQNLDEKIEFIQKPLIRAVGQKPDIAKLIDPIGMNTGLQLYALDQIRFEKSLPLNLLVAYSDSGKVLNLTRKVTSEKNLDWKAPPGKWKLYALFQGWHGKQVERAGPGGEGDVIDHFSGHAINNYLKHFDTIFKNWDLRPLRGYFNDSYEVDDASGQADWTNDLFYEFYLRRGYDLRENLPALFQNDNQDKNAGVLSDYRQTISDLILEKFTTGWTEWAHRQGKTTRDQAHGSPGNILDLYAASDIPETEGNEITRLKFASSASNVTGKRYTSCEAATWLNEHFLSTLADIKKSSDIFFLSGINHLFYHGTCFSPQDEPWPGFLFYAAVELTPANPLWKDFPGLNNYITRVQSFLQQGKSDNDILLYYPIFDKYTVYGKGLLEHFDGIGTSFNGDHFKAAADTMIAKGFSYDYISDLQLKNTIFDENLIQTQGNIYKTLIVPECKYIPLETFAQILSLAKEGAVIIFYGNLPENVSGWADKEEKTLIFNRLKSGINFSPTNNPLVLKATYGNGKILSGGNLEALLIYAGTMKESMADYNIGFTRRATREGYTYFIRNQGKESFNGWLNLSVKALSAAIFNPLSNESGIAEYRISKKGSIEVLVNLSPGESLIISAYRNKTAGDQYPYYEPASMPVEIKGEWRVEFIDGGPSNPISTTNTTLGSWTNLNDPAAKYFSGTAKYTISFNKPEEKAEVWALNLGRVCESASIVLNGKEMGSYIGPDFRLLIDRNQLKEKNILEISVSNLMANRIAYLDRNRIQWKKFYNVNFAARLKENTRDGIFDASEWQPRESGLFGPVTITPMKKILKNIP